MYDLGDLAGDVGGMVGMLLGASIFGLYQYLQNILLKYALTDKKA